MEPLHGYLCEGLLQVCVDASLEMSVSTDPFILRMALLWHVLKAPCLKMLAGAF